MRAVKVITTEAFRAAYVAANDLIKPKYVGIEYPEQEQQWPAILVQFRPDTSVQWTGLYPDTITPITPVNGSDWSRTRLGQFAGSVELTILALSSDERDQLWDSAMAMVLMADRRTGVNVLLETFNDADLVAITVVNDRIEQVGDSIGPGAPWNPDILTYEATMRFRVTGQFAADSYTQQLVSLTGIEIHPYDDTEQPFGESDGLGAWR